MPDAAAQAASRGLRVLDAPVSGGGLKAARGELLTMIGGDADTLELIARLDAAVSET